MGMSMMLVSLLGFMYPTYYFYKEGLVPYNSLVNNKLKSAPYKYYVLAVQKWCQNEYQIHGLWPQYDVDSWPENCNAPKYEEVYGDLLKDMDENWANCDMSTQDFWDHEYTKHLSCIYEQYGLTETESFTMTVQLFKELTEDDYKKCNGNTDCYVACYDLNLNKIICPT